MDFPESLFEKIDAPEGLHIEIDRFRYREKSNNRSHWSIICKFRLPNGQTKKEKVRVKGFGPDAEEYEVGIKAWRKMKDTVTEWVEDKRGSASLEGELYIL